MTSSRTFVWVAGGAAVLLAIPLGITATTAAWNDVEWAHGRVGTQSIDCGDTEGFATTSAGRFLSGALLGQDLDAIAALDPMTLSRDGAGALTVDPSDAIDLGSVPPTHTYADPLVISALSGVVGLDLTGLQVGLPIGSAGAVNQYAQVSGYGTAAGASGLVSNSGSVLVSDTTPPDDLPEPATIGIGTLLPTVAGIRDVDLQVGAVAASSQLDGCAALLSSIWGDGSVTGVTRDYGIAGLGLQLDAPAVSGLIGTVAAGVTSTSAAVNSLLGTSGLIATAIGARLDLALPSVLTTTIGGNVSLSGLDLAGAVSTLVTTPLSDGVVTIDLPSGVIDVDLDALLPSLNDAPPNTEVVLDAAVLTPIVTRVGTLLDNWSAQIVSALREELRQATLTIDLSAVVRAPAVPPIAPSGLNILDVSVDFVGTVGAVLDGAAVFTIDAEAAGPAGPINSVLAALGLPTLTQLITSVELLSPLLVSAVVNTFATTALATIGALGTTLSTSVGAIVSAVGSVVGALPDVVSVMVNVQPDRSGAPPGSTFVPGTADSTPQYLVSALRIGLADVLTPDDVAHVVFGTASAGPVTAP